MNPRRVRPLLLLTLALACRPAAPPCPECAALATETQRWHDERLAELRADQGWLTLAGLFWLEEGAHRLGADANADIVFPAGAPPDIGTLTRQGSEVRLHIAADVDARIAGASIGDVVLAPGVRVQVGPRFTFTILVRGERLALRLWDLDAPERRAFAGVPRFPVRGAWQVPARFERLATPRTVEHPTVLGTTQPAEVPGVAIFTVAGRELRLTPILEKGPHGDELLFVFRDRTSGAETYTGGRFLVVPLPAGDALTLDFNRAHNPPCAFTPYATCPVPLAENRLDVRVEAGEQTPAGH